MKILGFTVLKWGKPPLSGSVDSLVPTRSASMGLCQWQIGSVVPSGLCWRQILLAPPGQLESLLRFPTGLSLRNGRESRIFGGRRCLNFDHPANALSHGRNHRGLIPSGPPLEAVMFDSLYAKHIGHAFVRTGHPFHARKRDLILSTLDSSRARNANAQSPFGTRILPGDYDHRPEFRASPQVNPPDLTRFWLNHRTIRWS
jgi:hypothetical protein